MSEGRKHSRAECLEMFARLSEYVDGELDPGPCADVDGHMADCPPCRAFLDSLRKTVQLVQDLDAPPMPEDVRRRICEAYRRLEESNRS